MKIEEIRKLYKEDKIEKKEYGTIMFHKYEELLEYKRLLAESDVDEIVVNKKDLIFKIKECDLNGNTYNIDMAVYKDDAAAVPVAILSFKEGYEKKEMKMFAILLEYISKIVKEPVFFDIGANLGWVAINCKIQYPSLKCYAFEPISDTFSKLHRNIQLNCITNIETFNIGFSDKNCKSTFFYDIEASGASSMANLRELNTTQLVECEIRRLDDFVVEKKIYNIDIIKCDVEGAELLVYKGGIKSLEKFKPIIFSEMLRKWSAKFNYHPNDIILLLKKIGYECFVLSGEEKLTKITNVYEETVETNYFFLHKNKHAEIIQRLYV